MVSEVGLPERPPTPLSAVARAAASPSAASATSASISASAAGGAQAARSAGRERRRVAALVERELGEELREVAGVERLRQRLDLGHGVALRARQAGGGEGGLDLVAAGRVGVDADRDRVRRRLEGLAQRAAGAERPGGDDDAGVLGAPVGERRAHRGRGGVGGVLDEDGARAGEEAGGADGVEERGRVAAEVGAGEAGQPHLGRGVGADQRLDEGGALQGHPHRVGAEEERAGERRVGAGEEAGGVAGAELHAQSSAPSARRCRMRSARSLATRRSASISAARLA